VETALWVLAGNETPLDLENLMKQSPPLILGIPLYGLPRYCDLENLQERAAGLAALLEEVGCYGQMGPAPSNLFQAIDPDEEP
jgi:hypothetical protein